MEVPLGNSSQKVSSSSSTASSSTRTSSGTLTTAQLILISAIVVNQPSQSIAELDEALSRQSDGLAAVEARKPPGETGPGASAVSRPSVDHLADTEDTVPLVLLPVQVIFMIPPHQELVLQSLARPSDASTTSSVLATRGNPSQLPGTAGPQLGAVLDKVSQVVSQVLLELGGDGHEESE